MKEIQPSSRIEIKKGVSQEILPGYENEIAQKLNAEKELRLNEIFTNPKGRVTAVRSGAKDITSAVLTARLSRAGERDVTELYWKEFLSKTGEDVGDRILNEFGDDSVREDAGGYVFVRDVSVLTSMQIFRHPLVTGIEASTRYINWGELPVSDFAVLPEGLNGDGEALKTYAEGIKIAYEAYKTLWPLVWEYFEKANPREPGQSEAAYKKAVKGATCDALRGLLPLGVKTNFGLHANFRTYSELVMNMRASEFSETSQVGSEIGAELMKVNPVFMKVIDSEHGAQWTDYQRTVAKLLKDFGARKHSTVKNPDGLNVDVEILNAKWPRDLLRSALTSENGQRVRSSDSNLYTEFLTYNAMNDLLTGVGEARGNRRHKLPDLFNSVIVRDTIDNLSFGAYKDINRHRFLLYKSQPDFSGDHGFVIPSEITAIGGRVLELYTRAQNETHKAMVELSCKYPEEAKLLLTHGTKTSFEMIMGLGEHFWISELRSIPSGNPEYREIAVELYKGLIEAATAFKDLGGFVNEKSYGLGRIGEAVRQDLKGKK